MEYIEIGQVINTHGIKGEIKIQSFSDFDKERYKKGSTVYIGDEGTYSPFTVAGYRVHKGFPLVTLAEVPDLTAAEKLKGLYVYINAAARRKLPAGEYYFSDFEGLDVYDENDALIGRSIRMEETNGAQNNIRVRLDDGREVLIPYVKAFVSGVSLSEHRMTVRIIEGLL